jgi:hypothetical protein
MNGTCGGWQSSAAKWLMHLSLLLLLLLLLLLPLLRTL